MVLGVVIGAPRTLACASLPRVAVISAPGPDSVLVASMVVVNALAASPVTGKMPWGEPPKAPTPPVTPRTPAVEMVTVPKEPEAVTVPWSKAVVSAMVTGIAI